MNLAKATVRIIAILILVFAGCKSDNTMQSGSGSYFTVQVGNEQFVMLVTDEATIQLAIENFQGKNHNFPIGKIASGDGGYNQPWNWHYQPDTVRMTEVAIEVCDGAPSYVNAHPTDYFAAGYCPWSGKIIKIGR